MEPKRITWVPQSKGNIPKFAVIGGQDVGRIMHVARANHKGGVIVGKLHGGSASVPYGGQELYIAEYEVLSAPPGSLSWVSAPGGKLPPNAIQGGKDPNGQPYYIPRMHHGQNITCGRIHGTVCFASFGGKENATTNFEVLVRNDYGMALGV